MLTYTKAFFVWTMGAGHFSLFSIILINAQETTIDTIYAASPPLTGVINNFNITYELQVDFIGDIVPGDTGMPWIPPYVLNATERGYLSFSIESLSILSLTNIDSVVLRLGIGEIVGNDIWGEWPEWNVPGGDTVKCCIDHVTFGDYLDVNDWTAGDTEDFQTLTSRFTYLNQENYNPTTFYAHILVTDAVINDIENERDKTQFRIRFEIDTDNDDLYDRLCISAFAPNPNYYPALFIYSSDSTNVVNEYLVNTNSNMSINNYPNPFNPLTTIEFSIPNDSKIEVSIFNIKGQKIKTLAKNDFTKGSHSIIWNGDDESGKHVSSGIYYYKLSVNDKDSAVKKCLLLK